MVSAIITEGLIYSIMVLGVFMAYRVLNFCDMTVDGAFPMGACIFAVCVVNGLAPSLALLIAFLGGAIAGFFTTLIYTKLRIPDLLAGILMMTMLYSVNLRIMGKAQINFNNTPTIFSKIINFSKEHFGQITENAGDWGIVVFLIIFIVSLVILMNLFFNTDLGLTMGALGSNPQMVISQGVNPTIIRGIGICFGDGLAAVSGAIFSMYQGSANVGMGTGVIVKGLAALMLGELIIRSNKISLQTLRVIIGAIIYWTLSFFARRYGNRIGMTANDLNLVTGLLIIICLAISKHDIHGWIKTHLTRKSS